MTAGAQVRVLGPSRALLAIATGALVAVTSGATAFVVLSGGGGVVATTPPLEPLPVAAPAGDPHVVVLPPGALGIPAAVAQRRDAAAAPGSVRRTSPLTVAAPVLGLPLPAVAGRPDPAAPVPALGPVLVPTPIPAPAPASPVFTPRAPLPADEETATPRPAAPAVPETDAERAEKAERPERPEEAERPEKAERAERPEKAERAERPERPEKAEAAKAKPTSSGKKKDVEDEQRPAKANKKSSSLKHGASARHRGHRA